jgi:transposase
VGKAV